MICLRGSLACLAVLRTFLSGVSMIQRPKKTIKLTFKIGDKQLRSPLDVQCFTDRVAAIPCRTPKKVAQVNLFFLVPALLRDCSLCWDHWRWYRRLHLTQPCFAALGLVLIWVEHQVVRMMLLLCERKRLILMRIPRSKSGTV